MKLAEIRGKDSRELQLDLQAMRKQLFELRMRSATEELAHDSGKFRELRRSVARIKTILREREIAASAGTADSNAGTTAS